jgi:hypothetical protein
MKVKPSRFRGAIILQNQNYFCESDVTPLIKAFELWGQERR